MPPNQREAKIPNTIDRAFSDCSNLASITIPSSVRSIGKYAFSGCSSLTIYCEAVKKPSRWHTNWNNSNRPVVWDCLNNDVADDGYIHVVVEDIRYALKDNEAMVARNVYSGDIVIPSSVEYKGNQYPVTSIGSSAFSECSSLTSITIPSSVTSIGDYAFYDCDNLQTVYYGGNEEQWTQIQIGDYNYDLTSADRYYYSEVRPNGSEWHISSYWHWDETKTHPVIWH